VQQWHFIRWFYPFVGVEAIALGFLIRHSGRWVLSLRRYEAMGWPWCFRSPLTVLRFLLERLLSRVVFPKISEWDAFFIPHWLRPGLPQIDVVTTEDLLRGDVGDYFLDDNGQLTGLCILNAQRFRREKYRAATGADPNHYWKDIPGHQLYIAAKAHSEHEPSIRGAEEPRGHRAGVGGRPRG
jgi:hypothetical protein